MNNKQKIELRKKAIALFNNQPYDVRVKVIPAGLISQIQELEMQKARLKGMISLIDNRIDILFMDVEKELRELSNE